jgi:hypothetical protein
VKVNLSVKTCSFLALAILVCQPAVGRILFPGEYNGVVFFDRWDGCHLFTGVATLEISESAKEALRPYRGKAVLIDAQKIEQPMNPGIGLVTKLKVLGPAKSIRRPSIQPPTGIEDLSLRLVPSFSEQGPGAQDRHAEFFIELRNTGKLPRMIDTRALGPMLVTKKRDIWCWNPADGPSYSILSQWNVALMHGGPFRASCAVNGKGAEFQASLPPGFSLSTTFELEAGKSVEIPIRIEVPEGEFELLAGYGGDFDAPSIASNAVEFDVDRSGRAHLTERSLSLNQVRSAPRSGTACGTVTAGDGRPVARARVYLWPLPLSKEEPRVANFAMASEDGSFQMAGIREGLYVLSAARTDSGGIAVGAFGGARMAEATPLALPDAASGCTLAFAIRPYPTYSVRGRTAAGPGRTTRMILRGGDAFPFESTAVVQADGRYEHRVPAGDYRFFASNLGSGFRVDRDIDDLEIDIPWPKSTEGTHLSRAPGGDFNEEMAMSELRTIAQAQVTYSKTYQKGFARNFTVLAPPPSWHHATADHAGLLSQLGTPFVKDEDATHFTVFGYRFSYTAGEPDAEAAIRRYSVSARPIEFGTTGQRSFFLDETGAIRATQSDAAATAQDPLVDQNPESGRR